MVIKRYEYEISNFEDTIRRNALGALYERRTGKKVLNLHFLFYC